MEATELSDLLLTAQRSQGWLADRLGVRPNTIWRWANGHLPIPASRVQRIRALLDDHCPACGAERTTA